MSRPDLYLAVSLDVEEEGLFGGQYARRGCSTTNTACLTRLAPLCERGVRPTLFCAHSVLADAASRRDLAAVRDRHGAEIGAHLHHWNTPPLTLDGPEADAALGDSAPRVPAAAVPDPLMAAKLAGLMAAGRDFQSAPLTSFRMGRWDLHRNHWPLLAEAVFLWMPRCAHCIAGPLRWPGLITLARHAIPTGYPRRKAGFLKSPSVSRRFCRACPACLGALRRGCVPDSKTGGH